MATTIGKQARKNLGGKVSRYIVRKMKKETKSGKQYKDNVLTPNQYQEMKAARRRNA
jgi:hypothetical protein